MTLITQTFPGAPDGMGRYVPQHELSQTECWTLIDGLVNIPGLIRRRGPLDLHGVVHTSSRVIGLARAQDPAGVEHVTHLDYRSSDSAGYLRAVTGIALDYPWPYTPASDPQELFDSKDALGGGAVIGTAPTYDSPAQQAVALWRGSEQPTSPHLSVASSVSIGDATIALTAGIGHFVSVGHFIFNAAGALVGVVKSISTDTLTLEHKALVAESVYVVATALRGINPRVTTGRITTDSSSAVVNGGDTKFQAQGLGSGVWDVYTTDFTYIGRVLSVQADAQLTLTGNAAVSLLSSNYIAIHTNGSYALDRAAVGFLNTSFAGHQFYADTNKLRFSDAIDPEGIDLTADGNELEFSSDPLRAILSGQSALVALTEKEAYSLTGAIGTTPDRWRGERIHDDGAICGMGALIYKGGVIWPGERGIWFWNGGDPVDIASKLGDDYRKFVAGSDRAWGMVVKDHYFLFVEGGTSGVFTKTKGSSSTEYTQLTIVVNLLTGACSLLTNIGIRGAVSIPESVGLGSSLYGVTLDAESSAVALGDSLFLDDAVDDDTCLADTLGPDLYLESRKYDMGDGQRLKLLKMLLLYYRSVAGNLKLDAIRGLETAGTTVVSEFLDSATYTDKRVKFMVSSQFLAFRLYQSEFRGDPADNVAAATTRITLGPWAIGYKWKNAGRV